MHTRFALPSDLPGPQDDGSADHLTGIPLPRVAQQAIPGSTVTLADLAGRNVVVAYHKMGDPDKRVTDGWDLVLGARGCTPQACAFHDTAADFAGREARLFGLSTQSTDDRREVARRWHLPFPTLSDDGLRLVDNLGRPTFAFEGEMLLKRLAMVIDNEAVTTNFYPVFPSDRNAAISLARLDANPRAER